MQLERILFQFLDKNYDPKQPVLLGLSGGSDSLTLFHLLEWYKQTKPFNFGVAHVDHGWRLESGEEAHQLQKLAMDKRIPFHLKKLNPETLSGNLEQACRHERLAFFSQLCSEYGYQAIILGHHADDQSETILKKVLEGKSLPYLCGMSSISVYNGLKIWRPLLNCSKLEIIKWLDVREYIPFDDYTNHDQRYLRGRFRTKIIPELTQAFGKEIGTSLCRLGDEVEELKAYLDAQLQSYLQRMVKGPFGTFLDLSQHIPSTDFEIRYLVRKVCENEGLQISYKLIENICQKIRSKAADCQFFAKEVYLHVDRGILFVMKKPLLEFKGDIPIKIGQIFMNGWEVIVREHNEEESHLSDWKEAWMSQLHVQVPEGNYVLGMGNNSLAKWWTNAKVPAFMRKAFPVLYSENTIVHEFLTKRRLPRLTSTDHKQWSISISYISSLIWPPVI